MLKAHGRLWHLDLAVVERAYDHICRSARHHVFVSDFLRLVVEVHPVAGAHVDRADANAHGVSVIDTVEVDEAFQGCGELGRVAVAEHRRCIAHQHCGTHARLEETGNAKERH